ncbi:MAG: hypothetical protein QM755_02595 [Luteolibacter sp.]
MKGIGSVFGDAITALLLNSDGAGAGAGSLPLPWLLESSHPQ